MRQIRRSLFPIFTVRPQLLCASSNDHCNCRLLGCLHILARQRRVPDLCVHLLFHPCLAFSYCDRIAFVTTATPSSVYPFHLGTQPRSPVARTDGARLTLTHSRIQQLAPLITAPSCGHYGNMFFFFMFPTSTSHKGRRRRKQLSFLSVHST